VYPYLIAATRHLFGSLTAVAVLQALVGALLVPVVARLGRASFGAGAGLLAAAFVALSPVVACGLALGIAALTREPALYVLPLLAAWLAFGRKERSLAQAGLLLALALLTVAPWTARNYARYS